jgi:hypothetical protein
MIKENSKVKKNFRPKLTYLLRLKMCETGFSITVRLSANNNIIIM